MPLREPVGLLHSPAILLAILAFALTGCDGEGSGFQFPITTGTLQVTTSTTGAEVDPDGYTLKIDNEAPQPIGSAASIERTEVQPGDHTLFLGEVTPNCSVADNPRTLRIVAAQTLTAAFEVICNATSGGITVTTVTSGASPDLDGYSVVLDGVDQGPIPASGQLAFTGLTLGSHVVGLSGLAGNCLLQGDNLRTVTVAAGASTQVDYVIACAAPPAGAGTLRITTVTEGANPDPDGYSFALDGGAAQPIGPNAVSAVTSVAPGAHSVRLSGVAENCRLEGRNPRPVMVPAGGTADLSFTISCTQATGSIRVTATTTGTPADPNGYLVKLDNADPGQRVDADGSVRFDDVAVGSHTITLADVALNCTVSEGASRPVTVAAGATATVEYAITCTEPPAGTGALRITASTTGPDPDTDGYSVAVDDGASQHVDPNGTITLDNLAPGVHTVQLSGNAPNCTVGGTNPRSVTVTAGATADVTFTVTCSATTGTIEVSVATSGDQPDPDGYVVTVEGFGPGRAIGINGSETFTNVPAGSYTVVLSNIASNCTVTGGTSQSVSVTAGETSQVSFVVTCPAPAPTTGSIEVNVATSGAQLDPDGYTVTLDGAAPGNPVGVNGQVTFSDVSAGSHEVALSGVAENCTVTDATRTATVTVGETSQVNFAVDCPAPAPTTGSIDVNLSTSGEQLDPDGYVVILDGSTPGRATAVNDRETFAEAPAGSHEVALSGVASNCTATDPTRTVPVTAQWGCSGRFRSYLHSGRRVDETVFS
jgi:hypothetical protein